MPDSYLEAEVLVQLPNGNGVFSFNAPFVSDLVPAFMHLTVGADPETGNTAPSVTLMAYSADSELVSKTSSGNILTLVAIGADADSGDQAALIATWTATAGTLTRGGSDFEKRWTAPDFQCIATISVEVKDLKGATGRTRLPILVGIDNPSQVDNSRPTVTLNTEIEQSVDSEPFVVSITFNEPVTGFAMEDVTVTNGSLSDLTTLIDSRVFTVDVIPSAAGEVKITVLENIATDAAGNKNTAGNTIIVSNSITPPVKSSEKVLSAFAFSSSDITGSIDETNKAVSFRVPFITDLNTLVASFIVSEKAAVKIGSVAQVSGETENDFSTPVTYTVIAEDGSEQDYIVTVTKSEPIQIEAATVVIGAPVLGAEPQDAAAVEAATSNADYTVSALSWSEPLTSAGKFNAGQVYTATVTLTSKNYKKFHDNTFTPTVAGAHSVGTTATGGVGVGNTVVFTVTYASTEARELSGIEIITQPDRMSYTAFANVLALSGMVVTETFNDGSTNEVSFSDGSATGYTTSLDDGETLNESHDGAPITVGHIASGKTVSTGNLTILSDYTSTKIGTLRAVPAGTFQRDATTGNTSHVSAFRMSQNEITQAQFQDIMGSDPSNITFSVTRNHPVQNVSWYHALAFCNKLSIADGLTPVYGVAGVNFSTLTFVQIPTVASTDWDNASCNWNANGYRLPTEMEWMWAAMGAQHDSRPGALSSGINSTGYSKAFAGSDGSNSTLDYAWYGDNSPTVAKAVGGKSPNELGLHDMSGNVMEWCWSRGGNYPAGAVSDYSGATVGDYRVLRGGRFNNNYTYITVARRFYGYYHPFTQNPVNGFRVVRL